MENYTQIRSARPEEFDAVGKLMVDVYCKLPGFPTPESQPDYYQMLAQVGNLTDTPKTQILIATTQTGCIAGAVVYFGDIQYYGSGGTARFEQNAAGIRLLAVSPAFQGAGIGKALTLACIEKARQQQLSKVILHTTKAMPVAWMMYEKLRFERQPFLDFAQGYLGVFGFELFLH